jgi:HEAT repeat protein
MGRRRAESWASDELIVTLARLTGQQADGVLRIVEAELDRRSLTSLLTGPDRICNGSTYYGTHKRGGWLGKPDFARALELARRDYRKWLVDHGVGDALSILSRAAPEAARALEQEVRGDPSAVGALVRLLEHADAALRQGAALALGATGLAEVVTPLASALERETDFEVQKALIAALGRVAAWRDSDRRAAAVAVLDRADVKTAAKASAAINQQGTLTHVIDPETAGTIFDILAGAGALEPAADDAEDDAVHPAPADAETGGVPAAASD